MIKKRWRILVSCILCGVGIATGGSGYTHIPLNLLPPDTPIATHPLHSTPVKDFAQADGIHPIMDQNLLPRQVNVQMTLNPTIEYAPGSRPNLTTYQQTQGQSLGDWLDTVDSGFTLTAPLN